MEKKGHPVVEGQGREAISEHPGHLVFRRRHAYIVDMPRIGMLGTLEQMVLLSILQVGEDAYPPLILEKLEGTMNRRVARGSLYVTLDRLERKGMVRSKSGPREPERGGHPKRYLSVTESGIAALRECRESLMALWSGLEAVFEP